MSTTADIITPVKEGWLKKRGARMHRWSSRYFALIGASLTYKLKQDSTSLRGTFDLVPGCILTEVEEDLKGAKKGKKLFSFWIVWPQIEDEKKTQKVDHDSDGEDEVKDEPKDANKGKDLKEIVKSEVTTNRDKHRRAEEQLEKHHAQDNNLSMGLKVAAVAVGGVVVGALTAGIGLVPYITVVGITAVASGGAVAYQYRRPSDSRLILAAETVHEALAWKAALEEQIQKLDSARRPLLPESVDPVVISNILGVSTGGSGWVKVGQVDGVRILQQLAPARPQVGLSSETSSMPASTTVCRRAQIVIPCSPGAAFLSLMDTTDPYWPNKSTTGGSLKAVHTVDDHVDNIEVCIPTVSETLFGGKQEVLLRGMLSRFWTLDDDGCYLITLSPSRHDDAKDGAATGSSALSLSLAMDAVLTVSPRSDHEVFDDDLTESLVTCTVQIDSNHSTWRKLSRSARNAFMDTFVLQLLEMRERSVMSRFDLDSSRWLASSTAVATRPPSARSSAGGRIIPAGKSATASAPPVSSPASPGGRVVTTQPGSGASSSQSTFHRSSSLPIATPAPPPAAANRDNKKPVASSRQEDAQEGRARSSTGSSRHGMISRSHKVNAEAASIRSQIASKEFELVRLEKMVRKRGDKQQTGNSSSAPNISSQPSQVVMRPDPKVLQQIQDLLLELKELKIQYFRLTGVDYAQTSRSRNSPRAAVAEKASPASSSSSRPTPTMPPPTAPHHPHDNSRHQLPSTPAARSLVEKKPSSASIEVKSPDGHVVSTGGGISSETTAKEESERDSCPDALKQMSCPPHWRSDCELALHTQATARAATRIDTKRAISTSLLFLVCFLASIYIHSWFATNIG